MDAGLSAFPLSSAQARLWVMVQLDPGSPAFSVATSYRIQGPLDLTLFEQSVNAAVRRYDLLRTRFGLIDGQPYQFVHPYHWVTVPVIDVVPDEPTSAVMNRLHQVTQIPIDIVNDRPFRLQLFRLAEDAHLLLVHLHLMVGDRWSLDILVRDVFGEYRQQRAPSVDHDEPGVEQFHTHAQREALWLESPQAQAQLNYWRERFEDNIPTLDLITDFKRGPVQTYGGAACEYVLGGDDTAALEAIAKRYNVELSTLLMACYQLLLGRYASQDDLVVGWLQSGRQKNDKVNLFGHLQNYLPLRARLHAEQMFPDLLVKAEQEAQIATQNENIPIGILIEALNPVRDTSRTPLFQTVFAFDLTNFKEPIEIEGITITEVPFFAGMSRFELTLHVQPYGPRLKLQLEYNADLFCEATASALLESYVALLTTVGRRPEQRLIDLPLLTAGQLSAQRKQCFGEMLTVDTQACLHTLFEAQVARSPDAPAVNCDGRTLSYAQLNGYASRVAHRLMALGVGPETLVALCTQRSMEMLVGMLGILKAGGAYVPLDPAYPKDRLAMMMADCRAHIVVTTSKVAAAVLDRYPVERLCIDLDSELMQGDGGEITTSSVASSNLAYVIYTSGSTGRPKGVMIEHRNAVNLLRWGAQRLQPTDLDLVLAATSMCFDVSVYELFLPLTLGGQLRIVENLLALQDVSKGLGVTYLSAVPSAMQSLLSVATLPNSVRVIGLAGEPLPPTLVDILYSTTAVREVIDYYGPTEAAVYATCAIRLPKSPATIGRPIANTQVYFMDVGANLTPMRVTGELHIGGLGVARGYLNRPDLTAEKFVPDPFSEMSGARLYRSGDLGRYTADGNIQLSGRADHQVKIRGFRVELGEVEDALNHLPQVREAIVTVDTLAAGDKRLVAYLVSADDTNVTDYVREALRAKLPAFMVPSLFIQMDALPQTPSGKVDRRKLPVPGDTILAVCEEGEPRNELEHRLLGLWEEVLQVKVNSVTANFFQLGGHSLLAVKLVARLRDVLGVNVPLAMMFEAPTIASFAETLQSAGWSSPWYSLVPIHATGSRPALFAVHTLSLKDLPRYLGADQPLYFVRYGLAGELQDTPLDLPDVETLSRHYLDEIRRFQPQGPYCLMGASFGGVVAYEMARQLQALGSDVALVVMFDSYLETKRSRLSWWKIARNFLSIDRADFMARVRRKMERRRVGQKYADKYWPHVYTPAPDLAIWKNYQAQPYSGTVTLFKADEGWGSILYEHEAPEVAWRALGVNLDIRHLPGGHISMLEQPHVQRVAEELHRCVDAVIARPN